MLEMGKNWFLGIVQGSQIVLYDWPCLLTMPTVVIHVVHAHSHSSIQCTCSWLRMPIASHGGAHRVRALLDLVTSYLDVPQIHPPNA